jgi:hypothetical protein
MTDHEREAQLQREGALRADDAGFLLRRLKEARAEIARLTRLAGDHLKREVAGMDAAPEAILHNARYWLGRIDARDPDLRRLLAERGLVVVEAAPGTAAMERAKTTMQSVRIAQYEDDEEALVARAIEDAEREATERERERCVRAARGEACGEAYRSWPWYGNGNRANDDQVTKFADALARHLAEQEPKP